MVVFSFIAQQEMEEAVEASADFLLVGFFVWLVSIFLIRWLMLKYVLKLMNKKSSIVKTEIPPELNASEIKAKQKPTILSYDKNSDRLGAIEKREKYVKNAFVIFRKKYLYTVLACAVYLIVPLIFNRLDTYSIFNEDENDDGFYMMLFIYFLVICYALYILLVYWFYRRQFRPENTKFGFRLELPTSTLLRTLTNPRWESYISILLISMFFIIGLIMLFPEEQAKPFPWFTWGIFVSIAFHIFLKILVYRKSQQTVNVKLLILRVFGDKKNILFTFGRLTRFWEHFGSWFTVVDPSFLARKYRTFTLRTLLILVFIFIYGIILSLGIEELMKLSIERFNIGNNLSDSEISDYSFLPGIIISWLTYMIYWRFTIWRSYVKNLPQIQRRIQRVIKKPRKLDLRFKNLPMFCYDNTWKLAVSEFVKNSNVVLMDLRGFSAERKGCEYEVDFLLDTFPINNILFVIDDNEARPIVEQLISDRWEFIRTTSPNLNLEKPIARILAISLGDEGDVQTIIDLLLETTDFQEVREDKIIDAKQPALS
tara:strand:+ start:2744 stop:4363 length:1620 start_codon:yes stop_codon:yes gene_type:complete